MKEVDVSLEFPSFLCDRMLAILFLIPLLFWTQIEHLGIFDSHKAEA